MCAEKQIAEEIMRIVYETRKTFSIKERTKLIRALLFQARRETGLSYIQLRRWAVILFRNRERSITCKINKTASEILGGFLDIEKIRGRRFKKKG